MFRPKCRCDQGQGIQGMIYVILQQVCNVKNHVKFNKDFTWFFKIL